MLRRRRPRSWPDGRRRRGHVRPPGAGVPTPGRRPPTPRRSVCQPVQRHRWAASAWSTAASSAGGALGPQPLEAHTIPGVQKPHWLAPVAQKASAHASRSSASRPSTVVITRPATRRTGVTHEPAARRRPAPCSTRTGPGGCSRPWASARRGGRAGPRAARSRRRGPRPGRRRRRTATVARRLGGRRGRHRPRIGSARGPELRLLPFADEPSSPAGVSAALGALTLAAPSLLAGSGEPTAPPRRTASPSATCSTGPLLVGLPQQGGSPSTGDAQRLAARHRQPRGPARGDGPATLDRPDLPRGRRRSSATVVTIPRHADGVPIGYYPVRLDLRPGRASWTVSTELDPGQPPTPSRSGAGRLSILQVGQAMIPSSRRPPRPTPGGSPPSAPGHRQCPFHDRTLTDVLADDGPVALIDQHPAVLPDRRVRPGPRPR